MRVQKYAAFSFVQGITKVFLKYFLAIMLMSSIARIKLELSAVSFQLSVCLALIEDIGETKMSKKRMNINRY